MPSSLPSPLLSSLPPSFISTLPPCFMFLPSSLLYIFPPYFEPITMPASIKLHDVDNCMHIKKSAFLIHPL